VLVLNYYEHHLGDYSAATAHLSWDEDQAYTRLLRAYYHQEKPIPLDLREACRLVRASTTTQKKAVESVLREFFKQESDGWHQKRCDEEIERFQGKQSKARRSANLRWSAERAQSDGNANASSSQSERNANALPTQSDGNAPSLQSPDTNLQTPHTSPTPPLAEEGRVFGQGKGGKRPGRERKPPPPTAAEMEAQLIADGIAAGRTDEQIAAELELVPIERIRVRRAELQAQQGEASCA
jgi:uncharacterized protein YdaU (DUF1376 family)